MKNNNFNTNYKETFTEDNAPFEIDQVMLDECIRFNSLSKEEQEMERMEEDANWEIYGEENNLI